MQELLDLQETKQSSMTLTFNASLEAEIFQSHEISKARTKNFHDTLISIKSALTMSG